jgi:hypothetical protein
MALFVTLSAFLYQKGSTESKDPDGDEPVDRKPNPRKKNAPWPVRKGGMILALYQRSLTIALFGLFVLSFILHWYGSMLLYNEEAAANGEAQVSAMAYLGNARLWFESFENWQSEFLSVFAIVVLSIFLRDKGSAQSKPVDAADWETE